MSGVSDPYRQLPHYQQNSEWLTLEAAARELDVSNTVIKRLINDGVLPAQHVVECAPWVIERADVHRPEVQAQIRAVHQGRKLSRVLPGQHELPLK